MTIKPFQSDKNLLSFAEKYLTEPVRTFRKDIKICLTGDKKRRHAYFPALMRCVAFVELLSGLYAGNIESNGRLKLNRYAARFLSKAGYDSDCLDILYESVRNKVAHLGLPYVVFDTNTKPKVFSSKPRRRITWTLNASRHTPAIKLISYKKPRYLVQTLTPWKVAYDHRIKISASSFAIDIAKSVWGRAGYFEYLQKNVNARQNFAKCMMEIYPS